MRAGKSVTFIAGMCLLWACGCGDDNSSAGATPAATVQEEPYRYDDPRFSDDERQAVRVATEAIRAQANTRPDYEQIFRYRISRSDHAWRVTVTAALSGPGGHTTVILDEHLNVTSVVGGR